MKEVIERFETLRDLGVIMSETATFDAHLEHVCTKVRQKTGWVLRTFYTRKLSFMKTIYKSLILSRSLGACGPSGFWSRVWRRMRQRVCLQKTPRGAFNILPRESIENLPRGSIHHYTPSAFPQIVPV